MERMPTREQILESLRVVVDPELRQDIVTLGMVRSIKVSDGGVVKLDSRRQAIQDQYPLQVVKNADGSIGTKLVGWVPNVDQSFGGLFKPSSPAPGRSQPKCVKKKLPWQGKIRVITNGKITSQVIK